MSARVLKHRPRAAALTVAPLCRRFYHPSMRRYYVVQVGPDLVGDIVLERAWGSTVTRRGGARCDVLPDATVAARRLQAILRRRLRHGYLPS